MLIIPAIDIKNGKCVRLTQGDFASEKVYGEDPVAIAKQWEKQGAQMLHLVDLDGAKKGVPTNFEIIKNIAKSVDIPVQVGGGIRSKETVKMFLGNGIARVILGTIALENKEELCAILQEFVSQIAIALDAKNGTLQKRGWLNESNKSSLETALELERLGIQRFIYTDVVKDGTLTEPNYEEISKVIKKISVPVIVSGGIATLASIKQLSAMGVEGVIVGKALYEGNLSVKEALQC